jgi:(E)-4-hydroxy-3-methylbut-2-enyl-diphosphate synthase
LTKRRPSKSINIGGVKVGGDNPIVVQSMTKTDTRDPSATIDQVCQLRDCGCEIARLAVPDKQAALALKAIKKGSPLPIIADIHFDHTLALAAIEAGVDGLRLNPGNIDKREHVVEVVKAASARQVPIRIGVNGGSLPRAEKAYASKAEHMVDAAMKQVKLLESLDFNLIKVSLKAFDVPTTVEAYRMISKMMPYPLHIGITEAGVPRTGIIRSAVGIGILLNEGIGDTVRVSLSTDPCEEVRAAYEILGCLNLRKHGATLISCPTCGRCEVDLFKIAAAIDNRIITIKKPITVAVMGCVVNGPGEAKEADVGIAGGKGKGVLFKKGEVVRTIDESGLVDALLAEIQKLAE